MSRRYSRACSCREETAELCPRCEVALLGHTAPDPEIIEAITAGAERAYEQQVTVGTGTPEDDR